MRALDGVAGLTCIEEGREGGGILKPIGVLKVVEPASMTTLLPQVYQDMSLDELRAAMAALQTRGVKKMPRQKTQGVGRKAVSKMDKLDGLIAGMRAERREGSG